MSSRHIHIYLTKRPARDSAQKYLQAEIARHKTCDALVATESIARYLYGEWHSSDVPAWAKRNGYSLEEAQKLAAMVRRMEENSRAIALHRANDTDDIGAARHLAEVYAEHGLTLAALQNVMKIEKWPDDCRRAAESAYGAARTKYLQAELNRSKR